MNIRTLAAAALLLLLPAVAFGGTTTTTVTIAATPTEIVKDIGAISSTTPKRKWILLTVPTGGATVYIGISKSDVATTTGHELRAGERLLIMNNGDAHPVWGSFHGIVAAATQTLIVSYGD